ncbi:MAG TPA: MFS transporter [Bacteroidales bacterium]|nr:MFS transporter [Bacteroidales bacterium]
MSRLQNLQLDALEKRTFRIHFVYSVIEGVILGVLAINEFVFLKSLGGSDVGVSVLFQFSVFVLTFSVLLNEWARRIKKAKRFLIALGILTRFPMLLLFFFPGDVAHLANNYIYHYIFLGIFLVYYFANPIIYPVINQFLKTNYFHKNFSILYSWSTMANKIVMLMVTFVFGWLLDLNHDIYRYVFPVVSVLGIFSVWLLAQLSSNDVIVERPEMPLMRSIQQTIRNMRQKMRTNRPFRDFQAGFMFYGFAFMGTVSVIAIFFQKELDLNYSSVAFYKNSYNILAIFLLPMFGKMMGRIDPRRFAAIAFSSLLFYIFFIGLTTYAPWFIWIQGIKIYYTLLLAMIFNGFFAATMALLWSIGSAYFCPEGEVSEYQAIHLTFTGFRSFFAPIMGLGIYLLIGFTATFATGIILLLIAVIISLRSYKQYQINGLTKNKENSSDEPIVY